MRDPDEHIRKILAEHGEDFEANTWALPGGRSRAIKHHCTERMAAKAGIRFSWPEIISSAPDNVVIIVRGWLGGEDGPSHPADDPPRKQAKPLETWSFGEAAPKNNKNAYPYAIAEKRAKGRVALKLLGLHGLLHDETEIDDARPNGAEPVKSSTPAKAEEPLPPPLAGIELSANPHQARKAEDWEKVLGSLGKNSADTGRLLLWAKTNRERLAFHPWRKEAREEWRGALNEALARECHSVSELNRWREESHEHTSVLPTDWQLAASAVWEAAKAKTDQPQRELA